MNPELLAQLRALLGPSRTASTPLPPVRVTAPAREMTIGPSTRTASVGDEPVLPRLATELGLGMVPGVSEAMDVGRAGMAAREGDIGGTLGNLLVAGLGSVPIVGDAAAAPIRRAMRVKVPSGVYQNAPDEFRRIPARMPLPEHQANFERFYGQSVLRDPQGVPTPVVHGTHAEVDFNRFRMPREGSAQMGVHVTVDPRQAGGGPFSSYDTTGGEGFRLLGRLIEQGDTDAIAMNLRNNMRQGGRSMPLWARAENPLRLPDLGRWDPDDVMYAIYERYPELYRDIRGPNNITPFTESDMRRMLRERGYDSIVYRNRIEGVPWDVRSRLPTGSDWYRDDALQAIWPEAGDAYMLFSPRQLKSAIGNVGTYDRRTSDLMRALALLLGGGAAASAAMSPETQEMPPDEP